MPRERPFEGRSLHFIGIGGAGMSGLALVAHTLGATVSGSDRADSPYCARLRAAGIEPRIGHDAANVPEGADVVVSTAIPDDNVELAAARAAGAAIIHRGDLLGQLSRMKRTIAVGGTHGKTTTAAMAVHALREAGRAPAFLIGGELRAAGTNADWGAGEWAVIEADESDRSFLKLDREVAVVTNVELEHHATYRTLGELERAFGEFLAPASVRVLVAGVELPWADGALTFGVEEGAMRADGLELLPGGSRFGVDGAEVELRVPGRHNVLNALAALAACRAAGLEPQEAAPALAGFTGAARRFEEHGKTAVGGARLRRLRPPPNRGEGHTRGGPDTPARRASWPASSRTSTRARACSPASSAVRLRWPTSSWSSTSTRPGSAPRTSRASAACSSRGRRRTPRAAGRSGGCRGSRTPSGCCARSWARATLS